MACVVAYQNTVTTMAMSATRITILQNVLILYAPHGRQLPAVAGHSICLMWYADGLLSTLKYGYKRGMYFPKWECLVTKRES